MAARTASAPSLAFFLEAFAPVPGGSLDGGLFELLELRPTRSRSFASSASK
jgi:hypothetical protein